MFYFLEDFVIANYAITVRAIYYFQVILGLPLRLTIVTLNRKMNKYY